MGWVEEQQAKQKAKAKANGEAPPAAPSGPQSDEDGPAGTSAYVDAGVRAQLQVLRDAQPGTDRTRNTTLYVTAKSLGQLEAVDRTWLRERMLEACEENGVLAEDGERTCLGTIASGYRKADEEGFRDPDPGYFDRINVTEVPMSAFALDDEDSGPEPAKAAATVTPIGAAASAKAKASAKAASKAAAAARDAVFAAEGVFWDRPSLRAIYDAALMRMTPPWGVLANCVARALYLVPPWMQLPPIIGGFASLNWFAAVAAPSGGGKSSAGGVAHDLVKGVDDNRIRNMGSGEGIVAAYRPTRDRQHDVHALIFVCEEIDTMIAMRERQASTTMSVLRNMFMGDPPDHSYKKEAALPPDRRLNKHSYRATLVVGVQPGRASSLLDDFHSGTLQRFQWFPGFDPRCKKTLARPRELVTPLALPTSWPNTTRTRRLEVPELAIAEVLDVAERRAQGDTDAVDGHMMLVREKFAYGLAVLDGRTRMNNSDWRLSGIAMEVSRLTREWVAIECQAAEDEMAARRGRPMGLAQFAAAEAKVDATVRKEQRIAKWILAQLTLGPMTEGALRHTAGPADRPYVVEILNKLARLTPARAEKCKNPAGKTVWALPQQP